MDLGKSNHLRYPHPMDFNIQPNIHMVILECIKFIYSINQAVEGNPSDIVSNILSSMKNHSSKFLVLSRIAKDILVIPSSIIASESAFNVGRRVIDEKRICLTLQSIEMCV
ncbi:putative AC transposase, partial [Bienertia sinuspersici]